MDLIKTIIKYVCGIIALIVIAFVILIVALLCTLF